MTATTANRLAWRDGMERGSAKNPHALMTPESKAWNHGARCWSWAETWDSIRNERKEQS